MVWVGGEFVVKDRFGMGTRYVIARQDIGLGTFLISLMIFRDERTVH